MVNHKLGVGPIEETRKQLADTDFSAVTLPNDKRNECAYFYELLSKEKDQFKFRWLFGAFLNACYGYFEDRAAYYTYALSHPETFEPMEDSISLDILKKHIKVTKGMKRIDGVKCEVVKTSGMSVLLEKLYRYRSISTHDGGIGVMIKGNDLPEDFQIGYLKSQAIPALAFCREVLGCFDEIEKELGV